MSTFEKTMFSKVLARSFVFLVCGYEYICSTVQSVTVLIRNPRNDSGLPLNKSVIDFPGRKKKQSEVQNHFGDMKLNVNHPASSFITSDKSTKVILHHLQ